MIFTKEIQEKTNQENSYENNRKIIIQNNCQQAITIATGKLIRKILCVDAMHVNRFKIHTLLFSYVISMFRLRMSIYLKKLICAKYT